MLSSRDRVLAALFAFQLATAAVLGGFLVHALDRADRRSSGQLSSSGAAGAPGLGPDASTGPAAPGAPAAGPGALPAGGAPRPGPAGPAGRSVPPPGVTGTGTTADTRTLAAGAPIKVGAVVTQTGAINFTASAQATKAYFDMVNAHGGVNGHKILLNLQDDQLDPARGRAEAQQLADSGVFAFVGWNAPITENGIVPFLERNRIPLVGAYGEQEEYHSRYSFIYSASYGHYGFQLGSWLAEQKAKTPGFIFITNSSQKADNGLKEAFRAGLKSQGVTLNDSNVVVVDPTKASYDDVVTQFKINGVDGIATVVDQTAYNRLLQSMQRQAYRPIHVAIPLFVDPSVKQSAATDGTFVVTELEFTDGGGPAVQEYVDAVHASFGDQAQVNYIGEQGWVDAKAFVDAIRRMGSTITREKLISTLEATDGRDGLGFSAPLHFGPGVRDINRCLKVGKVVGGRVTRVTGWRCDEQPF